MWIFWKKTIYNAQTNSRGSHKEVVFLVKYMHRLAWIINITNLTFWLSPKVLIILAMEYTPWESAFKSIPLDITHKKLHALHTWLPVKYQQKKKRLKPEQGEEIVYVWVWVKITIEQSNELLTQSRLWARGFRERERELTSTLHGFIECERRRGFQPDIPRRV